MTRVNKDTKEVLIDMIIHEEWKQFQRVQNKGGRADCQEKPNTFYAMRTAQFKTWSKELLDSYLTDLMDASGHGENLLFRKYAYMMHSTAPLEYENIRKYLPEISEEKKRIIKEIVDIHLEWTVEFDRAFPHIADIARPETKDIGELGITSFRTYLEGELATYGDKTLSLYHAFTLKCKEKKVNLTWRIRENSALDAGFTSLEEAEELVKN